MASRLLSILTTAAAVFTTVLGGVVNDTHPAAWTGKIFADQPEVTLYGDYQAVVSQIKSLNPMFAVHINNGTGASQVSVENSPLVICGDVDENFATADHHNAQGLNDRLTQLAGYWELAGRKCFRLACVNTSGLFWCNDNTESVRVAGVKITSFMQHVLDDCCYVSVQAGLHQAQSGMVWFDVPSHVNGIVSYANCNDPTDFVPGDYIYPGPNGDCIPVYN